MGTQLSYNKEVDIERAIAAMIVAPTLEDAVEVLKSQGTHTTVRALENIRYYNAERYEKRREDLAPQLEGRFANNLLTNAERGAAAINMAIEQTQRLLEEGRVQDPARVARDLSQVVAQSVDKRLAIQGRPTQITEHRDVADIARTLQRLAPSVFHVVESTAEESDVGPAS